MGSSEFGGTDLMLVPGALYGLRAFHWWPNTGSLCSPVNMTPWGPEENVAIHSIFGGLATEWPSTKPPGHIVANKDCSCGFYSYHSTDQARTYFSGNTFTMMAVIEAYGRVTVGSLGMRSAKARIVGLVLPKGWFGRLKEPNQRDIAKEYPDAQQFRTLNQAASAFGITGKRPKILA